MELMNLNGMMLLTMAATMVMVMTEGVLGVVLCVEDDHRIDDLVRRFARDDSLQ